MQIARKLLALLSVFLFLGFMTPQNLSSISYISGKIRATAPTEKTAPNKAIKRDWTFLVYMAANNDLSKFSIKNIKQMLNIGSTDSVNIIVQLDKLGEPDIERIYIQNNKAVLLESNPQTVDNISGTPESLYNFISWGVSNFPSNKLAVVLWNHGSGVKDMNFWGRFLITHRNEIYQLNPRTGKQELNYQFSKNFNLMKKIEKQYATQVNPNKAKTDPDDRGIAMNDTFHVYLTNQDLQIVFEKAKDEVLGGKKIDIIFMDACFMAMAEIASQIKDAAKLFVASEEAEPGTGYNYEYLLAPFLSGTMTAEAFAINGTTAFEREYSPGFSEYTQSAMNLEKTELIEKSMAKLTIALIEFIQSNKETAVSALKSLRSNKKIITEFYDPDYIDLTSFCAGLGDMVAYLKKPKRGFTPGADYIKCLDTVKVLSEETINTLQSFILKSTKCNALPGAYGLAIYFPNRKVHESYYKTVFDQVTHWSNFLNIFSKEVKEIKNLQTVEFEKRAIEASKPAVNKKDSSNKSNKKNNNKSKNKTNKPPKKTKKIAR